TLEKTSSPRKRSINPIAIIGALFFIFGFVTWLNSVLIPYLEIACELNKFQSYFVTFAFYMAYLVMAPLSTATLRRFGFKNGMGVGLLIMAFGALLFIPAAFSRTYFLFLTGLFIMGSGLAILQTASNPYITIVGPIESAVKRMSIMGICNKLAGALAPIMLGLFLKLDDTDHLLARINSLSASAKAAALDEMAMRVIPPYIAIIVVLLVLAYLIFKSGLPEIDTNAEDDHSAVQAIGKKSVFQFPHVILGVFTLFLYVGVEVMAGDTIISYGLSQGIPFATAKFFTTGTLVAMVIGYIIGTFAVPRYISQQNVLKVSALLGLALTISAVFTDGYVSVGSVALLGLANSLMWPAIWPLTLAGLGRYTKAASSLLIMGISGGAIIPLIYGAIIDHQVRQFVSAGVAKVMATADASQQAYLIMLPCYLVIFYYAVKGHRLGRATKG